MTIIDLLTNMNGNYLIVLALLIGLLVEVVKRNGKVETDYLPMVASGLGILLGGLVGLGYQENIVETCVNGLIIGLLAMGGFDALKALWRLPEWLR